MPHDFQNFQDFIDYSKNSFQTPWKYTNQKIQRQLTNMTKTLNSLTGAPPEIFRVVPEPHMAKSISTVYPENAKRTNTHIHHIFLKRLLHGSFNSIVPFKCYCKQLWCWAPFKGLHQRWEALTFSGRTAGQMPAYFKRQTAPTLRPCCCSSSRTTTVSERQKVSSHTKSSSPSWQYVKWSDKEDIQEKKHYEGHPLRKV